jgi:hypothetical protein
MSGVVLAQMWDGDDHMNGGWWWLMGIGWLLFLALVVVLGWARTDVPFGRVREGDQIGVRDARFGA